MDLTGLVVLWLAFAGIGAAITNSKNRGIWEGLALGAILGLIGVVIAACLRKQLPKAPSGMLALQCARCNAVQNVPTGQPLFECWQCHSTNQGPGFEPPRTAVATSAPSVSTVRKVRCFKCATVQQMDSTATSAPCSNCGARMKPKPKSTAT